MFTVHGRHGGSATWHGPARVTCSDEATRRAVELSLAPWSLSTGPPGSGVPWPRRRRRS